MIKTSVIINTYNEGKRVASTCKAFLEAGASEIIVCSDGATDGSCDDLPDGVKVVRHDSPRGCGKSKVTATAMATGDVLCWVDAHQNVLEGDFLSMAHNAYENGSIACPSLRNIYYDDDWNSHLVEGGSRFYPCNDALLPKSTQQYAFSPTDNPLMVGVGLCMSRETYMRVGGWNSYLGRHGSQERGMSLRAFMAGVPVELNKDVVLGHEFFGSNHPSRNPSTGQYRFNNIVSPEVNLWHAYAAVLSESSFDSWLRPILMDGNAKSSGEMALSTPELLRDRAYFHRFCKRRADQELIEAFEQVFSSKKANIPADTGTAALEPYAVRIIRSLARGRCLEFGTGSGAGTKAILDGAIQVVSIDHLAQYTEKAIAEIVDERATFLHCPRNAETGFYDLSKVYGLFDFILIDGPPGGAARKNGIDLVLPHMAPKGIILVDDANRDCANIKDAVERNSLKMSMLPTKRGMAKIEKN